MKKIKKAFVSLAIAGMALTMLPLDAFATGVVPTRLAGTTAAQTAVAIADQTGYTGTAILASSASYGASDALTAGPLAAFLKAPILLQEPGTVLNADTKAELTKLNVKKVYVTSGTALITQAVLGQLAVMGIIVESLGGNDRFDTSVNIAKKSVALGAPVKKVAVAYGWLNQDALSIASIASAANEPIILTEKAGLSASAKAFLAANSVITDSDVIGGTGVIAASVIAQLPNATRHSGATAYDTNNQVIQDFVADLTFDNVYVANGKTGIDALAGAPLAAMTKSAIVLTDGTVPAAATFVHSKMTSGVVTALGGAAVVPETVRTGVATGVVTPPQGNLTGFKNPLFSMSSQVFLVTASGTSTSYGTGSTYEKTDGQWKKLDTFAVRLGANGISYTRVQNSGQTPAGVLNILSAFGIADNPGSNYAYHKVTSSDYWDLNSGSPTYNRMISSDTGGDLEHLIDFGTQYKYALVTDWNYNQSPDKGGAIFIHVNGSGATGSCISLTQGDMVNLITWLDPAKNPKVLVVPTSDLGNYFY